jgi:hypothetical protein
MRNNEMDIRRGEPGTVKAPGNVSERAHGNLEEFRPFI